MSDDDRMFVRVEERNGMLRLLPQAGWKPRCRDRYVAERDSCSALYLRKKSYRRSLTSIMGRRGDRHGSKSRERY